MSFPTIHTSATNLELSQERRALIERKLYPLCRLLPNGSTPEVNVVIRRVAHKSGDMFSVSAKLSTESGTYMAVSTGYYLTRVLNEVSGYLRQSLCYGESVATPFKLATQHRTIG